MNLLIKIITILLITYCGNFSNGQNCKAKVSIQTNVDKANLFIDSIFIGQGSNFIIELDSGIHVIYIDENLWKWNSKSIIDTINIDECRSFTLSYKFINQQILDTDPQDTYVFKDDSLIGFTPLLLENAQGEYILKKQHYLDKVINYQGVSPIEKPMLQFVGQEKGENFYESTLFKVLLGTAVALGATTAYYKLEADKKFDEYQITGNNDLLEQTDRYDVISGVTFVALQINFGLILYLFLTY